MPSQGDRKTASAALRTVVWASRPLYIPNDDAQYVGTCLEPRALQFEGGALKFEGADGVAHIVVT